MNKQTQTACIFGGTGFLGRYIVQKLAREGVRIKIATRTPQSAYFLRPYGDVGQIVPVMCDYSQASIENMIEGCDMVVNCVGILYEKGKNSFKKFIRICQVRLPRPAANIMLRVLLISRH